MSHNCRGAGLSLQQGLASVELSNLKISRVGCWCKKGIRTPRSFSLPQEDAGKSAKGSGSSTWCPVVIVDDLTGFAENVRELAFSTNS